MMKIENEIKKKIREKEKQLRIIKVYQNNMRKEEVKNINDDLSFKNIFNPFYKRKYKDNFGAVVGIIGLQVGIETEIKGLKELLK